MQTTPEPTLRERIGGRWCVSPAIYWFMVGVVAVTTVLLETGVSRTWSGEGAAVIVTAIFAGIAAVVMWLAGQTVFRRRRTHPAPVWAVSALGIAFGLLRLAVMNGLGPTVGLVVTGEPVVRIVGAIIVGGLLYPAIVLVIDSLERHRSAQRALLARLVDIRELDVEREGLVDSITDRVYAEVLSATEQARADLAVSPDAMSTDDRLRVANRLRETVVTSLRPLSHRLYASPVPPVPDVSAFSTLRGALRRQPLQPAAAGITTGLFAIPLITAPAGMLWPIPLLAASIGLMVYLGLLLVTWASRLSDWVRRHALGVGLAVVAVLMGARIGVGEAVRGQFIPGRVAGGVVLAVIFVLVTSLLGAAIRGEREITDELARAVDARAVDAAVANRELARVSRDIAEHVHGTLQSQLLATAFAVEQATAAGDDEAAAAAIEAARHALEVSPAPRPSKTDLQAEIRDRVSLWHGFMPIEVWIDPSIGPLDPGVVADAGRVVEEAIGNAHKHGGAVRVRVSVEPVGDALRVRVLDDGPGPRNGVHGMGFAWLDFVAPGAWSLTAAGPAGGAELCVDLSRGA